MKRTVFVVLAAILTAAIIHILAVFAVPHFAQNDVWHRSQALGPANAIHLLGNQQAALEIFPELDPSFTYAFCRVSVAETPVHLHGTLSNRFWTLTYLDPKGRHQYGVTNQISGEELDIVLATKGQQRLIAETPDLIQETTIKISATDTEGLLFLRVFIEHESQREDAIASLKSLKCENLWEPGDEEAGL